MSKNKATYDESSITVLEGLETVRAKGGMYYGTPDHTGIWQILKEVISNSVDEALAHNNESITIIIDSKHNKFLVADGGRGIPVGTHKTTKISTLTTILTVLHAGGKINANNSGYSGGSTGTHGVGVSVTNAVSINFAAYTCRDKQWWYQTFSKGKPVTDVKKIKVDKLPKVPNFAAKGTIIEFEADPEIFGKHKLLPKEPLKWIRTIAYFFPKVKWTLVVDGKKEEFQRKGGVALLTQHLLEQAKVEPFGKTFFFQSANVTCALQWAASDEENMQCYVNALQVNVGTHTTALNKVITDAFAKYKTAKQEFKPEDLRVGLFGVLNIALTAPAFGGQTKEKLISPEATELVKQALKVEFENWLAKNKTFAKELIVRAVSLRQAEAEFKVNRKFAAKLQTTVKGRTLLPPSLVTSNTSDASKRELFILEGKSAESTARDARDAEYQEILPLRGKILNVHKATDAKIAGNREVEMILRSVGYNPKNKNPFDKLRVNRVMLLADADADGKHINLLLTGFVYKALRTLIEQGRVFAVDLPLFTAPLKDKRVYAYTLPEMLAKLPANYNRDQITRMKGLGESLHRNTIVGFSTIAVADKAEKIAILQGTTIDFTVEKKVRDQIGTVLTKAGFLMCNPLHPILITRNLKFMWVAADDVQIGDYMLYKPNGYVCPSGVKPNIKYSFSGASISNLQVLQQVTQGQLSWVDFTMSACLYGDSGDGTVEATFSTAKPTFSAMEVLRASVEAYASATLSDQEVLENLETLLLDENNPEMYQNILTLFGAETILGLRWTPFIKSEFFVVDLATQAAEQYDITITKNKFSLMADLTNNSYLANNFVVHNCSPAILKEIAFNKGTRKLFKLEPAKKGKQIRRFLSTLEADAGFRREILGLSDGKTDSK